MARDSPRIRSVMPKFHSFPKRGAGLLYSSGITIRNCPNVHGLKLRGENNVP